MNDSTLPLLLAILYHESGRASVATGETMAHTVEPAKTRPFVEWPDLPDHVKQGRRLTACQLLERFHVGDPFPDLGSGETVESFAEAIHEAERPAVEQGLVLVKIDRSWTDYADLPEPAKAGRRRQATFLLARLFVVERRD